MRSSLPAVPFLCLVLACGAPAPDDSLATDSAAAKAPAWVYTTIDPEGSILTYPTGINDRGDVSVQYLNGDFAFRASLLRDGAWTDLTVPGAAEVLSGAPAPDGQIPLAWFPEDEVYLYNQAIWSKGEVTLLPDAPGWDATSPSGLTATGVICGVVWMDATWTVLTGYLWDRDGFEIFLHPDATDGFTAVAGCNARGQVVGYYHDAEGKPVGYLRTGDTYAEVAIPGAEVTVPGSVASNGTLAGSFGALGDGPFSIAIGGHGFLLSTSGRFAQLDVPGAITTFVTGVNAHDQVVGGYFDEAGNLHGFLATPR